MANGAPGLTTTKGLVGAVTLIALVVVAVFLANWIAKKREEA